MNEAELIDWMDRHHVEEVRTCATTLDGPGIGKHLNRAKFIKSLPAGHAVSDMALNMDITGNPHMTIWHPERLPNLGDIFLRPDMDTLIYDGPDPELGHVICDFTRADGAPLSLCPRSTLKSMVDQVRQLGYEVKCTFELEFYIFRESFNDLHYSQYQRRTPFSANQVSGIYNIRNAYLMKPFMREVTSRMAFKGIEWEGWNDEMGKGQVELNLTPTDPVTMADRVVRTKQMIYETAVEQGLSVTFMASLGGLYGSGMHVHHSLTEIDSGKPVFFNETAPAEMTPVLNNWLGGLMATLPGTVSYLCPTINSFRRFRQFSAVPMANTWGEDNKSTALRLLTQSPNGARIEHRVGAADLNPYLALSAILAGGIAGLTHQLTAPAPHNNLAWGLPASSLDLPDTILKAAKVTKSDKLLTEILGAGRVEYWAKTREAEWLAFHTEGGAADSNEVSRWEFQRYFETV